MDGNQPYLKNRSNSACIISVLSFYIRYKQLLLRDGTFFETKNLIIAGSNDLEMSLGE